MVQNINTIFEKSCSNQKKKSLEILVRLSINQLLIIIIIIIFETYYTFLLFELFTDLLSKAVTDLEKSNERYHSSSMVFGHLPMIRRQ